jgi:hypothetical protein
MRTRRELHRRNSGHRVVGSTTGSKSASSGWVGYAVQTVVNGGSELLIFVLRADIPLPPELRDSEGSGLSIALILGLIQAEVQAAVALLAWVAWVRRG